MSSAPSCADSVENLNRDCDCSATDIASLGRVFGDTLLESHAHLFSDAPVFIDSAHLQDIRDLVAAVHAVTSLPAYRRHVLENAPAIAHPQPAQLGVFTAFDFHVTSAGPKLIEINTNAGGALLNSVARRAQTECCPGFEARFRPQPGADALEGGIVAMFRREWQLARGADAVLRTIAIVDAEPAKQYLYPEFLLFKALFESHGITTLIADARELRADAEGLTLQGRHIDLVYNRLTDFYFDDPAHLALRQAYESGSTVVTPHPHAHALLASKRNLALFSDAAFLSSIGADAAHAAVLARMVPRTLDVDASERWWQERKDWFFKPADGFGSRGAYRGDKMTRRVFAEITKGRYVAQQFTPPGERWRVQGPQRQAYKVDVRAYSYDGTIQLLAARLYQGQTTNFRSAGGGFAAVYVI